MQPAVLNNHRYDLSNRLIHFFRDLDLLSDNAPVTPQDWGYSSITEDTDMPAFFLLRHCIRQGRIWATWSERDGKRTIYGPRPAVCFTEMPIPAFIEASRSRYLRGEAIAPYALVFGKRQVSQVGALPVIYGLSSPALASTDCVTGERLLAESTMPIWEQFRYVAHDAVKGRPDWSHEREWRWPCNERAWSDPDGIPPGNSSEIAGLDVDLAIMKGIGVVVATKQEVEYVVHDILTKVDRGEIAPEHYQFVLAHESIGDWSRLRGHREMEEAIHDSIIDLARFFDASPSDAAAASAEIDRRARSVEAKTGTAGYQRDSEEGGCWLWLRNNRHPLVRELVRAGCVQVSLTGQYLVELPGIDPCRPLQQKQKMIEIVARSLERDFGVPGTYFGVRDSWDPNGIVTFHADDYTDDFFWNFSSGPATRSTSG